ncbi:anti-sigma factor RsbA family regulatory protein [Thermomonospora amylolytica]|uniref:anti-sigma factor RsbA family regulatory protein n=1 Tax=Thermomonospora amylolytica TaxID=1411117 RepID=UPI00227881B6|nr:anti-sigma factor RsbA family regulatory protein [Thermomonospora amylolytica]
MDPDAVTWVDMTAAGRNPGRIIPGVLRAFADRHPHAPVRIIGEPIWAGRSQVEYPACVQHEALINAAFTGRPVAILCPYDAAALDDRVLADAAVTHPVLVDSDVTTVSDRYDLGQGVAAGNRPLPDPAGPVVELAIDDSTLMRARTTVIEQAVEAGLTRERALDAELAVNELTCNTVIHGGGRGILRIWTTGEHFVCQVDDGGHIADPLAGRRPVPPHVPGGRGLLLVNQLADLVRIHTGPGATTIRVHFDRPPRHGI